MYYYFNLSTEVLFNTAINYNVYTSVLFFTSYDIMIRHCTLPGFYMMYKTEKLYCVILYKYCFEQTFRAIFA